MIFIIGIIIGGAVVIFALQNVAPVMVTFLSWSFEGSVALIVLISLFAGIVISLIFSLSTFIKGMMAESKLRRHNESLRTELEEQKQLLDEANQKTMIVDKIIVEEDSFEDANQ